MWEAENAPHPVLAYYLPGARVVADWVSRAINRNGMPKLGREKEALFYWAVERRLRERLKINLTPLDVENIMGGVTLKQTALAFAAEAFAFGGEIYLGYLRGPEFGELPREIARVFKERNLAA